MPDDFRIQGDKTGSFFEQGGIGIWPFDDPRFNLESKVYSLRIYGRPREKTNPDSTISYEEHIALELSLTTYIVDALGSETRAVKEYILSKKGSPLSLGFPVWYWNTRKGEVRQFWMAGQPYFTGKMIPLENTDNSLKVNGTLGAGYTQQLNIDFDLQKTRGICICVLSTHST